MFTKQALAGRLTNNMSAKYHTGPHTKKNARFAHKPLLPKTQQTQASGRKKGKWILKMSMEGKVPGH